MSFKFGLLGYPVDHSYSPWIHQQLLNQAGLEGTYKLHTIHPSHFNAHNLDCLKEEQMDGFNVTVPFKQMIIPFLDGLDTAAERIGAVNTVIRKNKKWTGFNTDGIGFIEALRQSCPEMSADFDHRILLIGAGGAARAIYDALSREGYRYIDIANRTTNTAENLAMALKPPYVRTDCITLTDAEATLFDYDLIVQTTSVGMKPQLGNTVISLKNVKPSAIVGDIVYQPIETAFLKEAKVYGAKVLHGHQMLLCQAKYAFELWTGQTVQLNDMSEKLYLKLEGE